MVIPSLYSFLVAFIIVASVLLVLLILTAYSKCQEFRDQKSNLRAQRLLLQILTREQRLLYRAAGKIPVRGSHGGEYVVIVDGSIVGNIIRSGDSQRFCALCNHHGLPYHDHIAAQVVMLQTDELGVLRVANRMAE